MPKKPLVKKIKHVVEAYWVRQCAEGIPGNKADFILKNAFEGNWKEKSDVTMTLKQALVGYEGEENGNREGNATDHV